MKKFKQFVVFSVLALLGSVCWAKALPDTIPVGNLAERLIQLIPNTEDIDLEKIPVVLCMDEAYLVHAAVTVTSILENAKQNPGNFTYDIYLLLDGQLKDRDRKKWEEFKDLYGDSVTFNITFINSSTLPEAFPEDFFPTHLLGRWKNSGAMRLLIPQLDIFANNYDKVIYLDCDVLSYNLPKLWSHDFVKEDGSEAFLIGVKDAGQVDNKCPEFLEHAGVFNFPNEEYINSGILVMDIAKAREFGLAKKCFDFIRNHKPKRPDQDSINVVCQGNIKILGHEYSWAPFWDDDYRERFFNQFKPAPAKPEVIPEEIYFFQPVGNPHKPWKWNQRPAETLEEAKLQSDYHYYKFLSPYRIKKIIDIAYCATGKYLEASAVSATSVMMHANPDTHYHFYLIHAPSYSSHSIKKWTSLYWRFKNCSVTTVGYSAHNLAKSVTNRKVNSGKLLKVLMPRILTAREIEKSINKSIKNTIKEINKNPSSLLKVPVMPKVLKDVNKVIYLDGDIILRKPIDDLWDKQFGDKLVWAVHDYGSNIDEATRTKIFDEHLKNFGYADIEPEEYFNSGVMLMDLQGLREFKLDKQVIEWLKMSDPSLKMVDQPAFNSIFYQHHDENMKNIGRRENPLVGILPGYEWNCFVKAPCYDEDPTILQFVGWHPKPWNIDPWLRTKQMFDRYSEYHEALQRSAYARKVYEPEIFELGITADCEEQLENSIPIVYCTDENYLSQTGISITSLLENQKEEDGSYHIYILTSFKIAADDYNKFSELFSQYADRRFKINFVYISEDLVSFAKIANVLSQYPEPSVYRLLIPELEIFSDIEKLIYLDSDIIIKDFSSIWDAVDFSDEDKYMAAVKSTCPNWQNRCEVQSNLRAAEPEAYDISDEEWVNSGLLIMNPMALRNMQFCDKAFELIKRNAPQLPDQYVINALLRDHLIRLDHKYCMPASLDYVNGATLFYAIHYLGEHKPWNDDYAGDDTYIKSLLDQYYTYYKFISPWMSSSSEDTCSVPSFRNLMEHYSSSSKCGDDFYADFYDFYCNDFYGKIVYNENFYAENFYDEGNGSSHRSTDFYEQPRGFNPQDIESEDADENTEQAQDLGEEAETPDNLGQDDDTDSERGEEFEADESNNLGEPSGEQSSVGEEDQESTEAPESENADNSSSEDFTSSNQQKFEEEVIVNQNLVFETGGAAEEQESEETGFEEESNSSDESSNDESNAGEENQENTQESGSENTDNSDSEDSTSNEQESEETDSEEVPDISFLDDDNLDFDELTEVQEKKLEVFAKQLVRGTVALEKLPPKQKSGFIKSVNHSAKKAGGRWL